MKYLTYEEFKVAYLEAEKTMFDNASNEYWRDFLHTVKEMATDYPVWYSLLEAELDEEDFKKYELSCKE